MTTTQKQRQIVWTGNIKMHLMGHMGIKLSVSFDTGRLKELPKTNECLKRKLEKGDREETLETKAELPKKKIRPNLKTDLMEKLDAQNSKLMDQMETQHRDKLQRMDRMLDLFERSLDKK